MNRKYSIVDEFTVKSRKVFVLNRTIDPKDYNNSKIEVDGETFEFELTHNEIWITVDSAKSFLGKEVFFIA